MTTGTGATAAAQAPVQQPAARQPASPQAATPQTHQVDLSGTIIKIEKSVTHHTTTTYLSPWFTLKVGEAGYDKLTKLRKEGKTKDIKNWILDHMKLRYGKLPDGEEAARYTEALQIFEKAIWTEAIWLG